MILNRVRLRIVRIDVQHVALGMQIADLDRPWLGTPFMLQGFTVTTAEEIAQLQSLCEWVDVIIAEGATLPPPWRPRRRKALVARIERKPTPPATTSLSAEMGVARPAYENGLAEARRLYERIAAGHGPDVQAVRAVVEQCLESIMRNPGPMELLARLRDSDSYTCEHSLNVALLSMGFGRHLGLEPERLRDLGTAAMLHDIGKMRTPSAILNKPGRLDPDEAVIMRDHARLGYEILLDNGGLSPLAATVAHCHHEAPDGSGYPQRLRADSICDYTSMVTLADVFDAITAERPYKPARSSLDALKVIHSQRGSKFHSDLSGEFIRHIGLYPIGTLVALHTGELAVVVRHTDLLHLPLVVLLRDRAGQTCEPRQVDLRRAARSVSQARLIRAVLPNDATLIEPEECVRQVLAARADVE